MKARQSRAKKKNSPKNKLYKQCPCRRFLFHLRKYFLNLSRDVAPNAQGLRPECKNNSLNEAFNGKNHSVCLSPHFSNTIQMARRLKTVFYEYIFNLSPRRPPPDSGRSRSARCWDDFIECETRYQRYRCR